jgi:cbb3-type cytochrome oxidase maturation protein
MTAIIVLIVCSLIVAGGFLIAFLFSVKSGQYDDTYTPSVRMLFDEGKIESDSGLSSTSEKSDAASERHESLHENLKL